MHACTTKKIIVIPVDIFCSAMDVVCAHLRLAMAYCEAHVEHACRHINAILQYVPISECALLHRMLIMHM